MIKLLLKLTAVTAALAIAFSAAGPLDAKKDGKKKRLTEPELGPQISQNGVK